MAITCSNCKSSLGCGCQKRTTSDGKSACSKCLSAYEASIKSNPSTKVNVIYSKTP